MLFYLRTYAIISHILHVKFHFLVVCLYVEMQLIFKVLICVYPEILVNSATDSNRLLIPFLHFLYDYITHR